MSKCKSRGYCDKACKAQWTMNQNFARYKATMKTEYGRYKQSVSKANTIIRGCSKGAKQMKKKKGKPAPPKPPSPTKKSVPKKGGGTWSTTYWRSYMKTCQAGGMCRYACGAKYNVAYYKDRYRQASQKNAKAHNEYTKRYANMKKLKGAQYQKARQQLE